MSGTISFTGQAAETNSPKPLPFQPALKSSACLRVDLLRRSRLVVLLDHVDVEFSTLLVRPLMPVAVIAWALVEPLALRHGDGASRDVGWLRGVRLWVRRAAMSGRGNSERDDRTEGEGEGEGEGEEEGWTSILYNCAASRCQSGSSGRHAAVVGAPEAGSCEAGCQELSHRNK